MAIPRTLNVSDPKWAHPELLEENGYLIYHPIHETLASFEERTHEQLEEERNSLRGSYLPTAIEMCDPKEDEEYSWEEAWTAQQLISGKWAVLVPSP